MSGSIFDRWDPAALAEVWRAARPFSHIVLDDFLTDERALEIRQAVAREPHLPNSMDFYEMMGSLHPMQQEKLLGLERDMGATAARDFLRAVTGKRSGRVEMRSYVYLAGSYLLPHSDGQEGLGRVLSYSYYLVGSEDCAGGELDLFACDLDGDEVVGTRIERTIDFRANRLVLFDVGPHTLHQVREVTRGGRAALSGWFFV